MKLLSAIAKNRVVHFLAIGAALAAVAPKERDTRVVRAPTTAAADEELLAREAIRLGLGTDDAVVRARLAERMRANLAKALPLPTLERPELDAEIAKLVALAPERVRLAVWFVPKDAPSAQRDAEALARAVASGTPPKDHHPPIPDREVWTEEALARVVGVDTARVAIMTETGKSTGPLASAWGFYVFSVLERRRAEPAEVRAEAIATLTKRHQEVALEHLVDRVRHDYVIEVPAPSPSSSETID